MQTERSNFHIVTGGPGSGKTSLIEALRGRGYRCVDEVGRAIIQRQLRIGGDALHGGDRAKFLELMLSHAMADYERVEGIAEPVFFDRGIPELVGYCGLVGIPVPEHLRNAVELLPYGPVVFVAPPWDAIYRNDAERTQSFDEAVATWQAVSGAYIAAGYEIVELPLASVEARVGFMLERIEDNARA
jgi:predicted ATPase